MLVVVGCGLVHCVGVLLAEVQSKSTMMHPCLVPCHLTRHSSYRIMPKSYTTLIVYKCIFVKAVKYKMYWHNVLQPPK
jgi:hypothetical protein